ncbi:HEPN domain-containing protein [Marinobacterium litorale]|uniref:HEPN domain-containing protein n=1 Tax=Marinobacterium litorale TaxID=404770 RepID=UPI000420E188|nr:HEPN domain-containing protein [Marinobacterium litorale]
MKFRSLHKWDDSQGSKELILFAQLVDELLFEFTLDTYKPSAMNTVLLVREAIQTYMGIESGTIKSPNFRHVIDELCENLDKDIVAQSSILVDLGGVKSTLKDPKKPDKSKLTCLKLILNQMPLSLYKLKNEELLVEAICETKDLSSIRSLTRSYITTLLNNGYSEKYIQRIARDFFHYSGNRISGNSDISLFLENFKNEPDEFQVVYKGPLFLKGFKNSAEKLGICISENNGELSKVIDDCNFNLGNNQVYLITKCKAKEYQKAKKYSDSKIDQLQTLIGLYHHKESPKKITEGLVISPDLKNGKLVSSHFNPMHKCKDLKIGAASKKLNKFMDGFSMEKESFLRFNRSADLHALALASDSIENQLINLWTALESLLPSKDDDKLSQIEHISSSIMPFLNIGYIQKIVIRLSKDLLLWNSGISKRVFKEVECTGIPEKTLNLLALDKYEGLRNDLKGRFNDFHLLSERFSYLEYLMSSPSHVISSLDSHKLRVDWQIRRIYRARNMIVHDGTTPSYTEILIENTHDYLDTIFSYLMSLGSKDHVLNSIDQVFKMVELDYSSYYKRLSEKGLKFNEGNIDLFFENDRI